MHFHYNCNIVQLWSRVRVITLLFINTYIHVHTRRMINENFSLQPQQLVTWRSAIQFPDSEANKSSSVELLPWWVCGEGNNKAISYTFTYEVQCNKSDIQTSEHQPGQSHMSSGPVLCFYYLVSTLYHWSALHAVLSMSRQWVAGPPVLALCLSQSRGHTQEACERAYGDHGNIENDV